MFSRGARGLHDADLPHTHRRDFWYVWVTVFLGFLVVGTAWNVAQPPFAGTDELPHFNMAQAVWSGQFIPPIDGGGAQFKSGIIHIRTSPNGAQCYLLAKLTVPASCDRTTFRQSPQQQTTLDYVSREPPLAPLLTGLPAYLAPDRLGLFLSRGIDTMIGAVGIATAVALAVSRRRPFLTIGVVLATTPSVIAGFGVLGTSQLEIAAALVLWVAVVLLADGERATPRFMSLTCLAAVTLVLSRPISFVYLGLAVIALLIASGRDRLAALARSRAVQVTVAVVAVATLFALGWELLLRAPVNPIWVPGNGLPRVTDLGQRILVPLGSTQQYWLQGIGLVGDLSFPDPRYGYTGPWLITFGWTALEAAAVGMGLVFARQRRRIVAVGVLLLAFLLLPVVSQAITLPSTYLYWEGRYDLPILAGILTLAVSTLDGYLPRLPQLRRLGTVSLMAAPALVALLFYGALRRYAVGINGPLNPLNWGAGWRPALPVVALLVLGVGASVCFYGWIYLHCRPLLSSREKGDLVTAPLVEDGSVTGRRPSRTEV